MEIFKISEDETDFIVGIVSRNLATTSNFVKFRDSRNFTFSLAHFEWLIVCHVSGTDLVKQGESSGAHVDM